LCRYLTDASWSSSLSIVIGPLHLLLRTVAVAVAACVSPVALALDPTEKPANYIVAHWDTEDGLPHNSARHIFQTRDGYLWIATQLGLARFDGMSFTVFNRLNTPVMQSNSITSMAETSDGSLWIGTGVGLLRYRNGTFTCFDQTSGMKSETINAVCVAPDGSLWIGSRHGIVRWVDGKFVNDIDTSKYDTFGLRNITVDRKNAIWLAMGRGALRYQDGVFTAFGPPEGLSTSQLEIISEDSEGRIIAVTQQGLLRLEQDHFAPLEENDALSSVHINRILVDQAGSLWVGGVNGLDRCRPGSVVPYVDRFGDKLGVVNSIMEDREGCLWVGTAGGLYRLTDRRASSLTEEDGIPGSLVLTVQQTRDGSLWFSSWGAGVTRFHDGMITRYTVGSPLSHETISAIYEAPDGTLWFGNRGSSVDRLVDGKVTTYVFASGVATSRPVTALMTDDDGTLLLGISSRGLLELRNEEITVVPELAELNTKRATVHCIFRTSNGRLLIGTTHGVYQRRPDRTWEHVEFPTLPTLWVRNMIEVDGALWLATEGSGLVHWKNGEARNYGTREGMVADALFSVVDDGQGALWVSSARGLARIRKAEFSAVDRGAVASLNSLTFGRIDGLLSAASSGEGSPAAIRLNDGRIMTATDKGVAVVHPPSLRVNLAAPAVAIERILVDERILPVASEVTIAAGSTKLEIRFTALSLIVPERLRFRYKLEGSDTRWVEAGYARSAHYTHLAPGRYKFTVLASNNDGVWTETGSSIAITLLPRFYQTLWFRIASVVVFLALVAFIASFRIRQLERREHELARANAELDQRVKERTADLSRSHADIQQRELLFRLIFEHAPVGISWSRADLGPQCHFNSAFRRILDLPSETLPDDTLLAALTHPEDAPRQSESEAKLNSGQADSYAFEQRFIRKDGRQVSALLAVAIVRDEKGAVIQHIRILEDITALKQTEQELAHTYQRLMEASRMAGKAEVATSVLHNVGNVLNSVNVSTNMVVDRVRETKAVNVAKVAALLSQHEDDLAAFLRHDPRGQKIPGYLNTLSLALAEEQKDMLAELEHLRENVEHINGIVAMQQSNARSVGVIETVAVADVVDDVLRINSGTLTRQAIEIVRDFRDRPAIATDKHKVMQILINLVGNAQQACDEVEGVDHRIIVHVTSDEHAVKIAIVDTGVGIARENLTRIFNHGFTTKKDGHGFGLHSGALAAKELGGALYVESAGPGMGATFTLELPLQPAPIEALASTDVA
jgi:PAS domain S-box-containing protein